MGDGLEDLSLLRNPSSKKWLSTNKTAGIGRNTELEETGKVL